MTEKKKYQPPMELLILDSMGALILGLGLFEWFSESSMVPESLRFDGYELTLVLAGILPMLPLVFHFVAHFRNHKNRRQDI